MVRGKVIFGLICGCGLMSSDEIFRLKTQGFESRPMWGGCFRRLAQKLQQLFYLSSKVRMFWVIFVIHVPSKPSLVLSTQKLFYSQSNYYSWTLSIVCVCVCVCVCVWVFISSNLINRVARVLKKRRSPWWSQAMFTLTPLCCMSCPVFHTSSVGWLISKRLNHGI